MSNLGVRLRVKGKVQGVGFRPYVWQLAHRLELKGDVSNDSEGVLIRLLPNPKIDEFEMLLYQECPPLAKIDAIYRDNFVWCDMPTDFVIRHSGAGKMDTQVIPDAATCDACCAELFDNKDRRFRYPFINCTHCGPRFSIIKQMPYDRPNTSMADFALCSSCRQEYDFPLNRRFHAQPNACPQCGPHIWNCYQNGDVLTEGEDALVQAKNLLLKGGVLAIKGLGGFHLACDATNDNAVALLRQRKQRPSKPFAVMLPDISWLAKCSINDLVPVRQLLLSPASPIVLTDKKVPSVISELVAPDLLELGIMLPSNPLQYLLMDLVKKPLVMTSGNASGKPPVLINEQALVDLADIADMWLLHNRDIIQRADDSLVRCDNHGIEMMRRARGYVPDAIALPSDFKNLSSVIAMGADLKNTFCLLRDKSAVLSQHLGDLDDPNIQQQFIHSLRLFRDIYKFTPDAIVVDAHPGYVSHRLGHELAKKLNIPLIEVLHHHAHIVSCLAEHNCPRHKGPVIGVALDGLGYGENGQLWGGECLLVDHQSCCYLGGLPPVPLPGGDLASKQPWRNLLAHMLEFVPDWRQYKETQPLAVKNIALLQTAIEKKINSPRASSAGRLFDAVAAALGICFDLISWEGEAACKLEALATQSDRKVPPVTMPLSNDKLDLATFWHQFLNYDAPAADKAYAFHYALAKGFADLARFQAEKHGINTIAVSGGVMHNKLLRELFEENLQDFQVIKPEILPMGDGGLALGQAIIAAEMIDSVKR